MCKCSFTVPFESESLSELLINICTTTPPPLATLAPHLPPSLQAFWERGLAREPENRFQSGGELLEALRRCLADPAASLPAAAGRTAASTSRAAVSVSPIESTPVGRQSRNWPRHVIAGAIGVALTAGLAITAVRVRLEDSSTKPIDVAILVGTDGTGDASITAASDESGLQVVALTGLELEVEEGKSYALRCEAASSEGTVYAASVDYVP